MSVGLAAGKKLLFDSISDIDLAGSRNVELYVKAALSNSNKTVLDLDCIFVDIGPGGLGATRTTAAFANAIGFARKIPVIGINAFELIGEYIEHLEQKPVVCIRPAARPNYYMGLYKGQKLTDFSFADVNEVKAFVRKHQDTAAFAGKFSFNTSSNLPEEPWPTAIGNTTSMASFLRVALRRHKLGISTTQVFPITETLVTAAS
jgi:tRNA threonylcarbamoyladenosine biosynthesis protein TsaB